MKLHSFPTRRSSDLYGVAVPRGKLVHSAEEAVAAARELMAGGKSVSVVKAQIHAGGRGKGGGVKLARRPEEAGEIFKRIMGMQLVTHQTGPQGQKVRKVYVEEGCDIARELCLGVTLDRAIGRNVVMASSEGGVEIEEVAATHPEKILRAAIDPVIGLAGYQARDLAFGLGLSGNAVSSFVRFATGTYNAYEASDASIVEINPLVVTKQGEVIALDAKINLDDNALYRHKDLAALRDPDEEDPREAQAKEHDLSYVGLEGNIGCMINGAGLAMATMDMIKLAGGEPANFLDIGGGAGPDRVAAAFRLVLSDRNVKAILVNVFAGINRCDWVAQGVVQAVREVRGPGPLVVRLAGTNVEDGRRILKESGLEILTADTLSEAAERVVAARDAARAGAA